MCMMDAPISVLYSRTENKQQEHKRESAYKLTKNKAQILRNLTAVFELKLIFRYEYLLYIHFLNKCNISISWILFNFGLIFINSILWYWTKKFIVAIGPFHIRIRHSIFIIFCYVLY